MASVTVGSLGEYLREQRAHAQMSLRQLAEQAGVSNPYLSQVERGLRRPSAEVLAQLAKALRISAEALYVQAGLLEEAPTDRTVEQAISADPYLTPRQRRVLLDVYDAFRRDNVAAGMGPTGSSSAAGVIRLAPTSTDHTRPDHTSTEQE